MPTCPIELYPKPPYFGNDPKKKRKYEKDLRATERISGYINHKMRGEHKDRFTFIFHYAHIATDLGLNEKEVTDLLRIAGGSDNAIEMTNPQNKDL